MKILACIRQVSGTAEMHLAPKTNTLIYEGVSGIIDFDDKVGLEAALKLRETVGGTVTAVCMGPSQADVALREALAMGADEAYLLSDRAFGGSDASATAAILAAAVKKIGFDLIITGQQAIDGDTAQVGPQIAERLGIPQVSCVEELRAESGALVVRRRFEEQAHVLRVPLPCLATVLSTLNAPRYMHVGGIVDAYSRSITVWTLDGLKDGLDPERIGPRGSPTAMFRSFGKQARVPGTVLSGLDPNQAVAAIMAQLIQRHLI